MIRVMNVDEARKVYVRIGVYDAPLSLSTPQEIKRDLYVCSLNMNLIKRGNFRRVYRAVLMM